MSTLTVRQTQVLDLVKEWIRSKGIPPTRLEIAVGLGFTSPNGASEHLKALAAKGVLEVIQGTSRGIRLLGDHCVLQYIDKAPSNAASPQDSNAGGKSSPEFIGTESLLFSEIPESYYKVEGDGLANAGILPGDMLALAQRRAIRDRDIVITEVGGERSLWYVRSVPGGVSLDHGGEAIAALAMTQPQFADAYRGTCIGLVRTSFPC